jgi:glycine cleavage system H protein
MSDLPTNLKYAATHEWVRTESDGTLTIGITDHAQDLLGDVVFVELPEPGTDVEAEDSIAVVESVKAASDIYAPVAGTIIEVNEALADAPETVNESPFEDGWFFKIQPDNIADLDNLMSADEYEESL